MCLQANSAACKICCNICSQSQSCWTCTHFLSFHSSHICNIGSIEHPSCANSYLILWSFCVWRFSDFVSGTSALILQPIRNQGKFGGNIYCCLALLVSCAVQHIHDYFIWYVKNDKKLPSLGFQF